MKINLINFLIIITLLFSCGDDKPFNPEIKVGEEKGSLLISDLASPLEFSKENSHSIDINGDFRDDLVFEMETVPMPSGFARIILLKKKKGIQILLSERNDGFPEPLVENSVLKYNLNWSDFEEKVYSLQNYDCRSACIDHYLGVKKGNKMGWVKFLYDMKGRLIITEYAIMR